MKTILLVEDNQEIREILDMFLKAEGFWVESFATVKDFNLRNSHIIPDLYLFDVVLPDGSGIELCNQIKNNIEKSAVPVVIMSANAKIDAMKNLCQPDEFISKPFDLTNLANRLYTVINQKLSSQPV